MSRVENFVYVLIRPQGFRILANKEECEKTVRYVMENQDEANIVLEAIETFEPVCIDGFLIQKVADYRNVR